MKLAVLLLRNAGHTVLCAVDAEAGLTIARAEQPDLVLMDLQLPGMDGLAATTLLKQDPATAAIPVIALSAMAINANHEIRPGADCDAYLAKPLRYQELYAAIDTLLTGKKLQGAREADSDLNAPLTTCLSGSVPSSHLHGATLRQAPRAAAASAVDVGVLESLIGSDPAVILEFLNAFRTSASTIALELKMACDDGQPVQAGRQAHKLRSSAHIVGAVTLGRLCAEMEAAGKAGRMETLAALLPLFEQELDGVNSFLDSLQAPRAS
ncbi:MAG: response regulator [Sulfuritalea sp.]|jgi:two-component system cell cycle response regulator DivK|nr:response regulator [Sulfuritalea sp.]